nr:MAG TPA: hypothetical protein [Caudoviricetes sp.]
MNESEIPRCSLLSKIRFDESSAGTLSGYFEGRNKCCRR